MPVANDQPIGRADVEKFLAETSPSPLVQRSDVEQFLAETKPAETPVDHRDTIQYFKDQAGGLVNLAASAGKGLYHAVEHPIDTVQNMAESLAGVDSEGVYRAVRNTPLIGRPIDSIVTSAKALGSLPEGIEAADKAAQDYKSEQKQSDITHAKEHPLTDFLQRSVGLSALPPAIIPQVSAMAMDAFTKSLDEGNSTWDALRDAKNTALFVGTALKAGEAISSVPGKLENLAAREAQIPQSSIERYKAAPEAVNATELYAKDPETLKNLVDAQVAPITDAVNVADSGVTSAKEAVAATKQAPLSLAAEIPEHLDTQGAKLSDLSNQAIDRLAEEGASFPAGKLSGAVTSKMNQLMIDGVVPTVGPDATAFSALGRFRDMVKEIGEKSPDGQIPSQTVKELIQNLDSVSKEAYERNAGTLSPSAAGNFAAVRRNFDRILKDSSLDELGQPIPGGYAEKMAELAPQVQLVNDMSKIFGNEQMAMNTLKAAADPLTTRGHVARGKLGQYDAANGTDFLERVVDYYDTPKSNLQAAQKTLEDAQMKASQVNKLGVNSTEGVIPSIQRGNNIEARKQLENLNPEVSQTVQDAGILRALSKSTRNGSTRTVGGAVVGGAIGNHFGMPLLGGAVGGVAGSIADLYGGTALKAALDAGIAVDKLVNTPFLHPIMKAAAEAPKALAITHYMMSQTDPEYQKINSGGK